MNLILVIGRVLAKRRKGSSIKQHESNLPSSIFARLNRSCPGKSAILSCRKPYPLIQA
ncbi:hypothetical protein YSA_05583 [Pseudomonas putida ND6]|uniref:Uncharacterized protein n=1 Tax=Pseudomonas putida ND6 TaxID=231023 RepID=I3UWC0_PSEPU|nr:hypothetical protein YSA_05583 [Pseudomonas putida ND6]